MFYAAIHKFGPVFKRKNVFEISLVYKGYMHLIKISKSLTSVI